MVTYTKHEEYFYIDLLKHNDRGYIYIFGRVFPRKGYSLVKRNISKYLVDYVVSGRGYVEYGGKTYTVETGDLIFIHKGVDVAYGTDDNEPYEKLWICADGSLIDAMADCYLPDKPLVIQKNSDISPFLKLKSELTSASYDEQTVMHFILDIFMTLAGINQPADTDNIEKLGLAERVRSYIDSHITERYTLDDVAAQFHVSKRHMIRVFKEHFGKTPGAYHSELRLFAATHYLTETSYTISEIAAVLGYCDQSFFSTSFKKRYGMYPLAYRAQYST